MLPIYLGEEEFHTIDVRVKRSGVQVRARPGYYYLPAAQTPTTETEQKNATQQPKKKPVPTEKREGPSVK